MMVSKAPKQDILFIIKYDNSNSANHNKKFAKFLWLEWCTSMVYLAARCITSYALRETKPYRWKT